MKQQIPAMSKARAAAYFEQLKKGHAHKSKKDYDRKKLKEKLAKELKEV